MGPKKPRSEEAVREGTPECTGLELDPPEPESIQQAVSDKVPGKGSGGNRELGRAGNQAALNRRQHAREDLEAAGAALGTGSVLDMWMGEPRKVCEVSATPDCQEVKTRKNLRDYLIQTPVGQMGALRPRVGGLLWEQSQHWLLLPLLLPTAAAPVAMGTSLALRVSAAPPPPPSFPSNRPPPLALILACLSTPAWSPGPPSSSQTLTAAVAPLGLGSLLFWWRRCQPLLPLCLQVLHLSTYLKLDCPINDNALG